MLEHDGDGREQICMQRRDGHMRVAGASKLSKISGGSDVKAAVGSQSAVQQARANNHQSYETLARQKTTQYMFEQMLK